MGAVLIDCIPVTSVVFEVICVPLEAKVQFMDSMIGSTVATTRYLYIEDT